ncbi:MAG: SDR family oxidoreductase [Puniceicoccales bacterium]|jgi:dTDP-4-dehydrorhamnose reductase|nr:SDR family oxidoreductase [Puniceicoccales bacterium]
MKIVLTGASGFLGRETALAAVRRGHKVLAVRGTRESNIPGVVRTLSADLSRPQDFEIFLLEEFPDAIINCAAASSIEACEANPARAEDLNIILPRSLAMMANHLSARLIHVSSDMVFDGQHGHYAHTARPAPINLYGETKLAGEKEVLQYGRAFAVVLRLPVLSGNSAQGDHSLHERLLSEWVQGRKIPLYTDEICQPADVGNIAEAMVELCERDNLSGVYHWAGADALSRHEIGSRIAGHFGLDPDEVTLPVTRADLPPHEWRPRDLSLDLHPLRGKLKTRVQTFDEVLAAMQMPVRFADWHHSKTGRRTVQRLVRGVDF